MIVEEEIRKLRKRLSKFTISGSTDVLVEGGWDTGFAVNRRTGACCIEDECIQATRDGCYDRGGLFVGGSCNPNPCLVEEEGCSCIRVTFNDIDFDCGCQILGTGSLNYSDVNLNGSTFDMYRPEPGDEGTCSDCSYAPANDLTLEPPSPTVHLLEYSDTICGTLITDEDRHVNISVMKIGSTWGIVVADTAATVDRMVFYGETTDITSPVDNMLSCDGYPYVASSEFITCLTNIFGDIGTTIAVTSGGTATIETVTENCGTCCDPGFSCMEGLFESIGEYCEDGGATFVEGGHCGSCCDDDDELCSWVCEDECEDRFVAETECHRNDPCGFEE